MNSKDNVLQDFIEMIKKSWTYARLTEDERKQFNLAFDDLRLSKALKGTYKQRWNILNSLYSAFLYGVGYNSWNWREKEGLPF